MNLEWKRSLNLWLLLAPGVGFLLLFFGSPLLLAVLGGFGLDDIGAGEIKFTLEHYRTMLTDRIYLDGLGFTLYLALASTLLSLLIALPVTALLQRSFPGQRLFNALYKVPLIVPGVVAAFLVLTLADRGGLLPRAFERVGLGFPQLVRDRWALGVLIGMAWKSVPFMVLVIGGSSRCAGRLAHLGRKFLANLLARPGAARAARNHRRLAAGVYRGDRGVCDSQFDRPGLSVTDFGPHVRKCV